jgi:phosphoglucosamine mutase
MEPLFGTDGIRGVAGDPPLDCDTVYRVGFCLTEYLKDLDRRPRILVARDTRISGPWLEAVLNRAILDAGGVTEMCGVISTPAVSFLTAREGAQAGIMISASHNPYQDNGIKIFSSTGLKLNDAIEEHLELKIISSSRTCPPGFSISDQFTPEVLSDTFPAQGELYTRHLRECLPRDFDLKGMRLVVDCAHGALSHIAPDFLRDLGAGVDRLHCEPNGRNINLNAGALHLERLREKVRSSGADLGIAFDGDADRVMFVDSHGDPRDGDDVLYLLARYTDFGTAPRIVVSTVMANLGLELALKDLGFGLARAAVGDRYVLEEMLRLGAIVGGEQSGHIILLQLGQTGDGFLTALKVLEIIRERNSGLHELCRHLKRFPQVLTNVPVRERTPFGAIPGLQDAEAALKGKLGSRCRILLRYSGTEKMARIMVEGEDRAIVEEGARSLAAVLHKHASRSPGTS